MNYLVGWRARIVAVRGNVGKVTEYVHGRWPFPIRCLGAADYVTWTRVAGVPPVGVHGESLRDVQATIQRIADKAEEGVETS